MAADGLGPATYGAVLAGNGIVIVIAQPLAVRLLGSRDRSTVLAVSAIGVGGFLGPLLGTALLDHAGPTTLWLACAATGIALFAAQQAVAPALRHRTAANVR